jgi:geranylgeranyl pyrophosphate synthase
METRKRPDALAFAREQLLSFPEIAEWPAFRQLIERKVRVSSRPVWEYVFDGCEAMGSEPARALPAATAIFCMLGSIHLVDDLLDEEPGGLHHEVGIGTAANLAVALQGAAARAIGEADLSAEYQAVVQRRLGEMALATAFGQNLDASDVDGEEAYWRMVHHKSPPLFSCALEIGAILGGADLGLAAKIAGLGLQIGEIIQVNDDLRDALERPALPDWRRRSTNLPILFARTAPHDERDKFNGLLAQIDDPLVLEEAQKILARSGAVSYCAYRVIEAHRTAMQSIAGLEVVSTEPLRGLVSYHVAPLKRLLKSAGVESPEALFAE